MTKTAGKVKEIRFERDDGSGILLLLTLCGNKLVHESRPTFGQLTAPRRWSSLTQPGRFDTINPAVEVRYLFFEDGFGEAGKCYMHA